jgi:hypothetical protein
MAGPVWHLKQAVKLAWCMLWDRVDTAVYNWSADVDQTHWKHKVYRVVQGFITRITPNDY